MENLGYSSFRPLILLNILRTSWLCPNKFQERLKFRTKFSVEDYTDQVN